MKIVVCSLHSAEVINTDFTVMIGIFFGKNGQKRQFQAFW